MSSFTVLNTYIVYYGMYILITMSIHKQISFSLQSKTFHWVARSCGCHVENLSTQLLPGATTPCVTCPTTALPACYSPCFTTSATVASLCPWNIPAGAITGPLCLPFRLHGMHCPYFLDQFLIVIKISG